jgi:hypothetical protein
VKKLLPNIIALFFLFFMTSCIQQDVEESEFTVQAEGRIFERSERRGLTSNCKSTNDVKKDFDNLIKKYEPPIISPTQDKDVPGRIIMHRELIRRGGQLNTLEEAIYPAGFKTECFQELISKGFIWLPVNTNDCKIETNGDIAGNFDKKGTILVKWQTNSTTLWFKKKRLSDKGEDLLELYNNYLEKKL